MRSFGTSVISLMLWLAADAGVALHASCGPLDLGDERHLVVGGVLDQLTQHGLLYVLTIGRRRLEQRRESTRIVKSSGYRMPRSAPCFRQYCME